LNQSTADRLVTAAAKLLEGGVDAVTLRAVAKLVGVSHNAPYKHFKDRSALLAAVAERDFLLLKNAFDQAKSASKSPLTALKKGIAVFIAYGREHPAR
jgi:AcrR family transcriptional regulator